MEHKVRKMNAALSAWLLLLVLSSCSTLTPHENFKAHMESNIGSSIDQPREPGVGLSKYLLSTVALPNGNIENEYQVAADTSSSLILRPELLLGGVLKAGKKTAK
jgi:hypothetical protein